MTVTLALCMMVKDEEGQLAETLNSVGDWVDYAIVLDTGSTDKTVAELEQWSVERAIPLYLKQSIFCDFATSRNELLAFAEQHHVEWLLLMDAGDVLCGNVAQFKRALEECGENAFYLQQIWSLNGAQLSYLNIRCIRARAGWVYKGAVHEFLTQPNGETARVPRTTAIVLYQNRDKYGAKSVERFERDYHLLAKQVADDSTDARARFYLAQTCVSLGKWAEGAYHYKKRSKMGGFSEEVFTALLEAGRCERRLGNRNKAAIYWIRAMVADLRAEPLVELAELYRETEEWSLAFVFISLAVKLGAPHDRYLFVDSKIYKYTRWYVMGIIAYYVGELSLGEDACRKAIVASQTLVERERNETNLEFYLIKRRGCALISV